jgi:photosystem II stability/assembly factor-like uncharacterized protein
MKEKDNVFRVMAFGIGLLLSSTVASADFGGLVSVYQGAQNTDAFSSVAYLGQGIVVAGKRSWKDYPPYMAIYRSTDYGLTWKPVPNPSARITGRHVYFFGQHDSRVFAGTGDEGDVCLMRSDDYGATWSVVLNTAEVETLAGTSVKAVFSPVYMGNNRWLLNLRNDETGSSPSPLCTPTSSRCTVYFLESLANGDTDTWHAFYPTGIDTSARKMILTSDGRLLYAGFVQNDGVYVSRDGGYSFSHTSWFPAFSGMADLGNGSYLAGTYDYPPAPPAVLSIYKSSDYGQTWTNKATVNLPSNPGYFRTIIKVTDDLVIAYASGSEFIDDWSNRCAEAYASKDGGETWADLGPAFVGPYGNMHAIYDTVLVKPGIFVATAQPDSNILRSKNPQPVARCQDVTMSADGSCQGAASVDNGSYDPNGGALSYAQIPAGPYPLGTTLVTLVVTNPEGGTDSCTAHVTVKDITPPTISCPGNLTVNATSVSGAAVSFPPATASDNCSASVTVMCTPASGSIFAIGTIPVTCTATDTFGNTATCTFNVKVKSAAEQTADLIAIVQGLVAPKLDPGVRNALVVKLQHALVSIDTQNQTIACQALQDFINLAEAQKGKKIIPASQATLLIDEATRIRAVLGCP